MNKQYQFFVHGQPKGPKQSTWYAAAWDAVHQEYATWYDERRLSMPPHRGGEIREVWSNNGNR